MVATQLPSSVAITWVSEVQIKSATKTQKFPDLTIYGQ